MSRFYGSASRFKEWPRKTYAPVVQPLFDPEKPLRYCEWADHWTTSDAPDPAGKGCQIHRSVHWRRQAKAAEVKRWCLTCFSLQPRDNFRLLYDYKRERSNVCQSCEQRAAA